MRPRLGAHAHSSARLKSRGAATLAACAAVALALGAAGAPAFAKPLDYEMFKTKVEPIFLETRGDHARCYACHSQSNNGFHLQRLTPGAAFWSETQSRKNFAAIANVVNPADPMRSPLLLHPLAPEAGGDAFHSGGRQFESKDDPDWRILAAFIGGETAGDSAQ